MTTAGEWTKEDSVALDEVIVAERKARRVVDTTRAEVERRRTAERCAMEVQWSRYKRWRCRQPVERGSRYCLRHLEGI